MVLCVLLAGMLTACHIASPPTIQMSGAPGATTWIVANPAALSSDLAQVRSAEAPPPSAPAAAAWAHPVTSWMTLEQQFVAREWVSAPRAARCYALIATALNDTMQAMIAAEAAGQQVSVDAALAAAASTTMIYLHPMLADVASEAADQARWVGVWRSETDAAAVLRGTRMGTRVAQQVIAWAAADGAEAFTAFSDPAPAPGVWQRTPPRLWSALDPGWGRVRPMGLRAIVDFRASPPPAWESRAFQTARTTFADLQQHLTDADRERTRYWAAGMGSMTPSGMWIDQATRLLQLESASNARAAQVYAHLAVTMHNAFIACWESKYHYLVVRPITWMRETNPAWVGTIETPPFPSYPSGHAMVSGAASTILAAYFPHHATMLHAMAEEAAWSRVTGGIHWKLDSDAGMSAGTTLALYMLAHPVTAGLAP